MRLVDSGAGAPVVVIPGIQGRWEWMRPGIDALARECRVVTFSLADEPTCGGDFDATTGFACYVEQVRAALDQAGIDQAAICGVSYGGLVAAAFAAKYPERTASLVLVSALPPSWRPDPRVRFYLRAPRLLSPLFLVGSLRLYREVAVANPGRGVRTAVRHGLNVLTHMFSPGRMARRVHLIRDNDVTDAMTDAMRTVRVPTLVVTGLPTLDRVVPVRATHEYLRLWPHAEAAVIDRTGHLGIITRPDAFAAAVAPFVRRTSPVADRRRVG